MTTVREELESLLKVKQKVGELDVDYAARVAIKANKIGDNEWASLSKSAQQWVNDALEAQEKYAEATDEEYAKNMPKLDSPRAGAAEEASSTNATKLAARAKGAKPSKAKKGEASDRRGRPPRFDLVGKINILVDKYPRRQGTDRHKAFSLLKEGMSVEDALKAGISSYDLMRAVRDKDIAIK